MILNILGGGGSGKTSIQEALLKMEGFKGLVPYTTRPRRPGELDGIHYHFISENEYHDNASLVLRRFANGWFYGVLKQDLVSQSGQILVTIFDAKGIRELENMGFEIKVAFLNVSEKERKRRMIRRGDNLSEISKRISLDRGQIDDMSFESPILEIRNKKFEEVVEKIIKFVNHGWQ